MDPNSDTQAQGEVIFEPETQEASAAYIGRWQKLISTTNWEKGRIIWEWRETLVAAESSPRQYSDEAWSQLVGSVTPQHVGRLRRVWQRFGEVYQDFETLYWSHFFAALDWHDAEMYLEGAMQNGWSVSQMRRTRWEAEGGVEQDRPREVDEITAELDEDHVADKASTEPPATVEPVAGEVDSLGAERESGPSPRQTDTADELIAPLKGTVERELSLSPPNAELLPVDVVDAYEALMAAILHHKRDGWQDVSQAEVLEVLDYLRHLATDEGEQSESGGEAPF